MSGSAAGSLEWILDRMPHRPPMLFIDEVTRASYEAITCRSVIGPDHIALRGGSASSVIAVELIAQSAAALMVFRSNVPGADPFTTGALVGSRQLDLGVAAFRVGDELVTEVRELWGAGLLGQMEGVVYRDSEKVAEGVITVMKGSLA